MRLLNVGGSSKQIPIPVHYSGWEHMMLDINPGTDADVVCDAREMCERLPQSGFDAVYCSHNLEHYFRHDLPRVLAGFRFVLEDDGFVEIHVPNMQTLFAAMAKDGADIEDVMYHSSAGPIKAVDMIYGLGSYIDGSNDFMCHKNGFTPKSLGNLLLLNGFPHTFVGSNGLDLAAFAFKQKPTEHQVKTLNLRYEGKSNPAVPAIKPVPDLLTAQPDRATAGLTETQGD